MKGLNKKIIVMLSLFFVFTMSAQKFNEERYKNIIDQLKLDNSDILEDLIIEKKMPNGENRYISVIPVYAKKIDEDYYLVRTYILINDGEGTIKYKYFDPVELTSDAIMLRSFTINTGLFNLNTKKRAFGIVADYRNGSQPNPYFEEIISLYYVEGKALKKILSQYQINQSGGEWGLKCAGEFYDNKSTILLDKGKTNGFTDLKIKTTSTIRIAKEVQGDCKEKSTSKISYKILKFDKSIYK